jgi:hypothetical protein
MFGFGNPNGLGGTGYGLGGGGGGSGGSGGAGGNVIAFLTSLTSGNTLTVTIGGGGAGGSGSACCSPGIAGSQGIMLIEW